MTTISIAEVEMPRLGLVRKKIGTPAARSQRKADELPLCQVEHDLRLDTIQILRTGTNAIGNLLSKSDAAFDLIAPYIPAFGGLAGEKFDARDIAHELDDAVSGFLRFLECSSMWLMMT